MTNVIHTPDWAKDAIFYQIFPDRFAKSDRLDKPTNLESWLSPPTTYGFKGGDLLGVVEHLDYLQDLGINAIYLNPIFQSASNHRYHTHDYFRVDPLLGSDDVFRQLIKEAHHRRIRIILDGVFNHASRGFFQFNHILETGASSPYIDWFTVSGYPLNAYHGKPRYKCWWGLPALPVFNIQNPQVRQYILSIARYWIEQGIDGWRLDVPFEINDDLFWQEFRHIVKTANPEAYIVGEIPIEAQRWLKGDQFDAVMNYQFTQAVLGFFGGEHIDRNVEKGIMGLPSTPILDASGFAQRAVELLSIYPKEIAYVQMNLLDSHDIPRFSSLVSFDRDSLRLAVLFQMIYPGAPCIYYGDEIGLRGGQSGYPEPSRASFPWDQSTWDIDLLSYYQKCISLRNTYPALRRGDIIILYAEKQILALLRRLGEECLLVVINNGDQPESMNIPIYSYLPDGVRLSDWFTNREVVVSQGWINDLSISARTACVFRAVQ